MRPINRVSSVIHRFGEFWKISINFFQISPLGFLSVAAATTTVTERWPFIHLSTCHECAIPTPTFYLMILFTTIIRARSPSIAQMSPTDCEHRLLPADVTCHLRTSPAATDVTSHLWTLSSLTPLSQHSLWGSLLVICSCCSHVPIAPHTQWLPQLPDSRQEHKISSI